MKRNGGKTLSYIRNIVVFAMLGTLIFISKILLEFLPNVHMIALFIGVYTVIYREKALIPLYVFVFLTGIYGGFNLWWVPYLYIWTVLWGICMLLPKHLSAKQVLFLFPIVNALHGMAYGTLYAPFWGIVSGYTLKQTLSWIVTGLPWDAVHAVGNFGMAFLALPLIRVLERLEKKKVLTDGKKPDKIE